MKTLVIAAALAVCGLTLAAPTEAEARGTRGGIAVFRAGSVRPPAARPPAARPTQFIGRLVRRAAPVVGRVARVAAPIAGRGR